MANVAESCEEIVTYLNMHVDAVVSSSDDAQIAKHSVAVSEYFEAVAICELLVDAEIDLFFHGLIRSAQTRKWWLLRVKSGASCPRGVAKVSGIHPQFSALIVGQLSLAKEIAALSGDAWLSDVEYEDDFCYGHFLNRYLLDAPKVELEAILTRFEVALEGQESIRLALCRNLLMPDKEVCEANFLTLLANRKKFLAKIEEQSAYASDALYAPNSAIFIEGLAWLKLFERVGVCLEGEYMYCPSPARSTTYAPFKVDGFPGLPL
ncbi:MAG: hypothetical protein AABY83_15035 [Pseudomonadota bacterium]